MSYRELGLLATVVIWLAFIFLLTKWRGKKWMSLSLHAARARHAYFFFAFVLLVSGTLFSIFILKWFIPQFGLPVSFTALYLFTMLCLLFTAVIPDSKGTARTFHRIVAYTFAFMLAVLVVFILSLCSLSIPILVLGGLVLAYMSYCMITFALVRKSKTHFLMSNYLILQVAYVISFQMFILVVAYLG